MKKLVFIADALIFGIVGLLTIPRIFAEIGGDFVTSAGIFAAGALVGLIATPLVVMLPARWFVGQLRNVPARDVLAALLGASFGLALAVLLFMPLSALPDPFGAFAPVVVSILLAGVMGTVFWSQQATVLSLGWPRLRALGDQTRPPSGRVVLDTSAIIDGRVADIVEVGFLGGTLVIPQFILVELQKVADSSDAAKRARGRRGLEVLNRIQKSKKVQTEIVERDFDEIPEVDRKLVALARELDAPIVTNDFNLDRVAEIQGLRTLNVNSLANALKAVVMPGEDLTIKIIQEGTENGQGVGFLDDGTMVVVENGFRFLNEALSVVVTRVLTTAAGRMIFANPRPIPAEQRVRPGSDRQAG